MNNACGCFASVTVFPLIHLLLPDVWGTEPGKLFSLDSCASCLIFSLLLPELAVIPEATKQFIDNHPGRITLFSLLNCETIRQGLERA